MKSFWLHFYFLLRFDLKNAEKLFSQLLYGLAIQILVFFVLTANQVSEPTTMVLTSFFLSFFVLLKTSLFQSLDEESRDRLLDVWFVQHQSYSPFFESMVAVTGMRMLVFAWFLLFFATLFSSVSLDFAQVSMFLGMTLLMCPALCLVGIFVKIVVQKSARSETLFSLIFYPLTVPVFLAGVHFGLDVLRNDWDFGEIAQSWGGLLVVFNLVYLSLGYLFSLELLKAKHEN